LHVFNNINGDVQRKNVVNNVDNTTPDLCTGEIWQHKMPIRGDFLRPPHGTNKSVVNDNINGGDVQRKNVVNNVDNTTPDLCTGEIWQHKMPVRGETCSINHPNGL